MNDSKYGNWTFSLDESQPNEAFVQWKGGYATVHGAQEGRIAAAKLIAAAPELFDVCEQVITHYSGSLDFQPAYVRMARAAIAKARGEL